MGVLDVQISEKYRLTALLTVVGGFLEAYTFLTRAGVFANAQTGNIARIGLAAAGGDFRSALGYLLPPIFFVAGVSLAMQIRSYCQRHFFVSVHWQQIVVLLETVLLSIVGFIPAETPDLFSTVTISFVCALQVESFRKFRGNAFASTMCTGNLRSATENLNNYLKTHDNAQLTKSLMYFGIDLIFIFGVMVGCFTVKYFGNQAIWACSILLAIVLMMMSFSKDTPSKCLPTAK